MKQTKEDMTGWIMSEHGVPDSRWKVLERAEDYVSKSGYRDEMYLCECSCEKHTKSIVYGKNLRYGKSKSCGCVANEINRKIHKKKNEYDLSGNYGVIWLTNTNQKCYFDLEDADKILSHTWFEDSQGYAATHIKRNKIVRMHTLLGFLYYDHEDKNKLNNQKSNLRKCTVQQNNFNNSLKSTNTSGIIGVSYHHGAEKWRSYININGRQIHRGLFQNKEDAIKIRLKAEAKYYGEFAPQKHLFEQYKINIGGD